MAFALKRKGVGQFELTPNGLSMDVGRLKIRVEEYFPYPGRAPMRTDEHVRLLVTRTGKGGLSDPMLQVDRVNPHVDTPGVVQYPTNPENIKTARAALVAAAEILRKKSGKVKLANQARTALLKAIKAVEDHGRGFDARENAGLRQPSRVRLPVPTTGNTGRFLRLKRA